MTNLKIKTIRLKYNFLKEQSCKFAVFAFCYTSLTFLTPSTSHANTNITNDKLKLIAKDFVKKVNKGFSVADKGMEQKRQEDIYFAIKPLQQGTTISDGEELILQVLVGPYKIPLNFNIIAIKESNDILISLSDFFAAADLAISVNPDDGIATGWFIRENQEFFLNAKKEAVTIMGKTFNLPTGAVQLKDGDIYATSYTISQWFDMRFIIDFKELSILLTTTQPLPAEERYARHKKKSLEKHKLNQPKLPYKPQPYKMVSIPSFDVNLRSSYSRFDNRPSDNRQTWSVLGSNDFAYLNTKSFISGNNEDGLNTARFTFSRESDNKDLLGPLKAQKYSFGDVYTTRLTLTGSSPQEQGVRITNTTKTNLSSFTTTDIRGDAQPGWDIELYRNDRFVKLQKIGDDGSYNFEDVSLFVGENNFRLISYGSQGEIEEERRSIPVDKSQTKLGDSSYDISLTRNNEITYRKFEFNDQDDGNPHIVARYDRSLGKYGNIHAGIRNRNEESDNKTYIETGISTNIRNTLVNVNTAVDATNGGLALELITRRKLGKHSLFSKSKFNTKEFDPGNESIDTAIINNKLSIKGPVKSFFGLRTEYGVDTNYFERSSGFKRTDIATSLGTRIGNTIVSSSLKYSSTKSAIGETSDSISGSVNMRGFLQRLRWRLRSDYRVSPTTDIQELFAALSYPFSQKLDTLLEIRHFTEPKRTELTGSLNWKNEKAIITPRISIDTDNALRASVNARFGVGYEPQNRDFSIYNKRLSTSGGVSAKVFLDKDGDGVFGKEDELLPGVELDAVQSRRSAITDETGIAFIPDLPENRPTDIQINTETFEDPFWISSYKGLSLKPRPGIVMQVEFPIVVSGEIDGTVYLQDKNGNKRVARQYVLHLFTPDGREIQRTASAFDGFYIFSSVPPGTYFLVVNANHAEITGYTLPLPKRIDIKPDGTTIYGEDITLTKGNNIEYIFTGVNTPQIPEKSMFPTPKLYSAGIILGQYKSRLAMTLAWYKLKIKHRDIGRYFELITAIRDIKLDDKTHKYMLRLKIKTMPILDIETAYMACKKIAKLELPCTVEIISYYSEETASIENINYKKF